MARSTPTAIFIVASLFCLASGGWAELVGLVVDVCDTVGASKLVRLMREALSVTAVVDSAAGAAVLARLMIVAAVTAVVDSAAGAAVLARLMIVAAVTAVVDSAVGAAVLIEPEERELVEGVAVENTEVPAAVDCSDLSIAENGYGSREVVKLVSQQVGPPRPCPAAPAQHQLLPLGSQRLTSVKSSN